MSLNCRLSHLVDSMLLLVFLGMMTLEQSWYWGHVLRSTHSGQEGGRGGAVPNVARVLLMETSVPTTQGTPANLHMQAKNWED